MGAGPDQAVAVCLSRRAELVVSLLGVMKSGAAYVPLDPAYPPHRTGFILESCGAGLVITERALAGGLADTPASAVRGRGRRTRLMAGRGLVARRGRRAE